MPSDEQPGFWKLAKELTAGVWGITKEVGKETRIGIKSYSENTKVEAQKHRLKHFDKMKKLEKRAKDAGISEESLARFIKELGVKQKKSEDRSSEPEGSGSLLEGITYNLDMVNESLIEARFEQYINRFNKYKKLYKEAIALGGETLVRTEEILNDCGYTLSELKGSADEESSQKK